MAFGVGDTRIPSSMPATDRTGSSGEVGPFGTAIRRAGEVNPAASPRGSWMPVSTALAAQGMHLRGRRRGWDGWRDPRRKLESDRG